MATAELAIRTVGLERRFGELVAVRGLSMEVARGELFGLVGPDGAGKTTTLRMLAGVLPPSGGEAELAGVDVVHDPEGAKAHLAYMSQRFGLYADLTVRENLLFYADLYEVPRSELPARIERLYGFSRLGPFEDRLAGRLSGGMKQKLGLCCALVHHPEVLLLDEPTFGVDPVSRRELWVILHEMVAEGMTALVSTAYMDEAERFDRLALMHRGRTLVTETPSALQGELAGRTLEIRSGQLRAAREVARALPEIEHAGLFGDRLHVVTRSERPSPETIRAALEAAGIAEVRIRPIHPSLEDVVLLRIREAEAA